MIGAMIIIRIRIIVTIWIWVMSLVLRVINDGVPNWSNSCNEKPEIWVKSSLRKILPNPMAICDDKKPANIAQAVPPRATNNMKPPVLMIYSMLPLVMPLLTISDIKVGKYNSAIDCKKTRMKTTKIGILYGFKNRNNLIILTSPPLKYAYVKLS